MFSCVELKYMLKVLWMKHSLSSAEDSRLKLFRLLFQQVSIDQVYFRVILLIQSGNCGESENIPTPMTFSDFRNLHHLQAKSRFMSLIQPEWPCQIIQSSGIPWNSKNHSYNKPGTQTDWQVLSPRLVVSWPFSSLSLSFLETITRCSLRKSIRKRKKKIPRLETLNAYEKRKHSKTSFPMRSSKRRFKIRAMMRLEKKTWR